MVLPSFGRLGLLLAAASIAGFVVSWSQLREHDTTRSIPKKAIAVAVTRGLEGSKTWRDVFLVFAYAAQRVISESAYSFDLLALVPDTVPQDERALFTNMGFQVVPLPLFVKEEEVENKEVLERMKTKGCCGMSEMIKLYAAGMVEYDHVLVADGDSIMLRPFDELFELSPTIRLFGTYDHGMSDKSNSFPLVQGGWLLFRPNLDDFDRMRDLVREGDHRQGSGWKGSGTGYGWGGVNVQGIVSFHYNHIVQLAGYRSTKVESLGKDITGLSFTKQPHASAFKPLNRAVYNVMATADLREVWPQLDNFGEVKSFHFAGDCMKPWACQSTRFPICESATAAWFALRAEVAAARGLEAPARCKEGGKYEPLRGPMLSVLPFFPQV